MINTTTIIRHIEKRLGYKFNELEISHDEIIESIKQETLVNFSKYFPYQEPSVITKLDLVEGHTNKYFLKSDLEILGVARVYDTTSIYAGSGLPIHSAQMIDPFSRQIMADAISMNKNPLTYQFEYPNMVTIMPAVYSIRDTKVLLNCVHPDHFGTIPVALQDEFLKLALLDTKESLYMIRHRFANLQSAYGNIELFIDDLAEATDKKEELFEKWRRNFGKQSNRKKIYVY